MTSLLFIFLFALPQADNPLATLKSEVAKVLTDAKVPFTEEQETAVVLMMEDRRKASETLFGNLMDFRSGPTQGQEADRLRSAIEWMRNEFLLQLQNFLTPDQLGAWSRHQALPVDVPTRPQRQDTQFVRINNNIFTSEDPSYRYQTGGGSGGPEVIQRGGGGAWHGTAQLKFKDDALNAPRRAYDRGVRKVTVKPPYSEHDTSFNLSGPLIPGRLTSSMSASHVRAENVDTVSATLGDGTLFGAEVVHPTINKSFKTGGTYQITDRNSFTYNIAYSPYSRLNQGVGGFVLPERAYATKGNNWNTEFKQFSALSARSILEARFNISSNHDETVSANGGLRINVSDAFSGGGAQNDSDDKTRNYEFSTLYTRLGERLTIKTGTEGVYRKQSSLSLANYDGTFSFSSLADYRAGRPITYRVTRGVPLQETRQLELSMFMQQDLKLTPRFTLMYGLRYEVQTNINDHNNFGPRVGLAYAVGQGTVLRAGMGVFYNRVSLSILETQKRLNGTNQYELLIDNPTYPDPFLGGTLRNTIPSFRVIDPTLAAPYVTAHMVSIEKTFGTNFFVSAAYDFRQEVRRARQRNINASLDITSVVPRACPPIPPDATPEEKLRLEQTCQRPDPTKGQILNLESTGGQTDRDFRLSVRKRFSVFNVTGSYLYQRVHTAGSPTGDLPSDNYNLGSDWSRAFGNPHQTVDATLNAQTRLGIFLSGTMSYNTGRPYNITTGKDDNRDSSVNDRPLGVPRNAGPAQQFLVFNFNISKAIFFGDSGTGRGNTRKNMNVFANMTNAFNHVNYAPPSGVKTSPNFGYSTNGGDPREIEAGLRFQF